MSSWIAVAGRGLAVVVISLFMILAGFVLLGSTICTFQVDDMSARFFYLFVDLICIAILGGGLFIIAKLIKRQPDNQ